MRMDVPRVVRRAPPPAGVAIRFVKAMKVSVAVPVIAAALQPQPVRPPSPIISQPVKSVTPQRVPVDVIMTRHRVQPAVGHLAHPVPVATMCAVVLKPRVHVLRIAAQHQQPVRQPLQMAIPRVRPAVTPPVRMVATGIPMRAPALVTPAPQRHLAAPVRQIFTAATRASHGHVI